MLTLDHVAKRYRLGSTQASLRNVLAELPRAFMRRQPDTDDLTRYLWALRDISFSVAPGETLGIVGRNGAGKTTILKILSRITQPTSGTISIDGRVGALIELGAGFHPDLTGLENIYLYGTILGLSRRDVDHKLKSIVDFSELDTFMDTPVKRYSSGMYARLAFSVAAHIDPDVLLIDEVLSVGDSNFQQKCLDFIHSFVKGGKTTVFISHNHYAVEQLCQRLVWLDHGRMMLVGDPGQVLERYLAFLEDNAADDPADPVANDGHFRILSVRVSDTSGQPCDTFTTGDDVLVTVEYDAPEPVDSPRFCVWVSNTMAPNPLFAANMVVDGTSVGTLHGRGSFECVFRRLPLMPRLYHVWVEAWGSDRADVLITWQRWARFHVVDPVLALEVEHRPGALNFVNAHGPVKVDYEWYGFSTTAQPAARTTLPQATTETRHATVL